MTDSINGMSTTDGKPEGKGGKKHRKSKFERMTAEKEDIRKSPDPSTNSSSSSKNSKMCSVM